MVDKKKKKKEKDNQSISLQKIIKLQKKTGKEEEKNKAYLKQQENIEQNGNGKFILHTSIITFIHFMFF
jgi:hypothetical protein